jgi:hypothetical protein
MRTEAVKAGFYETEYGKYPRLQIFTVDQLPHGAKPSIPLVDVSVGFRKAGKESGETQHKLL